jgi:hypothetical protein
MLDNINKCSQSCDLYDGDSGALIQVALDSNYRWQRWTEYINLEAINFIRRLGTRTNDLNFIFPLGKFLS